MSRRKTDDIQPEQAEQTTTTPTDELESVVREWLYFLAENMPTLAVRLVVDELHAAGIHSQAGLATAPIPVVAAALRAAWQTDAHSLTGAAARFVKGEPIHDHPQA